MAKEKLVAKVGEKLRAEEVSLLMTPVCGMHGDCEWRLADGIKGQRPAFRPKLNSRYYLLGIILRLGGILKLYIINRKGS